MSVLKRSPHALVEEIILVNDFSDNGIESLLNQELLRWDCSTGPENGRFLKLIRLCGRDLYIVTKTIIPYPRIKKRICLKLLYS
jgi:hypothetical protein